MCRSEDSIKIDLKEIRCLRMFSETLLELYFVIYMYTHSMIILFLFGANDLELFLFERHPK